MPDDLQRDPYPDSISDELSQYPAEQPEIGYEGETVDEDNSEAPLFI